MTFKKEIVVLALIILALTLTYIPITSLAEKSTNTAPPIIIPAWQGASANAVAFSDDEKYVFVWTSAYGWVHGDYVLVVDSDTSSTPYIRVYRTETGELVAQASGVGLYKFDGKSLTKLWTHTALSSSMRGYIFVDKIVVVTTGGVLYVFDFSGNVIKSINLGIDNVDSGFAVTEDGVYVAVGAGGSATFPSSVVLVNLRDYSVTQIASVNSRVLRLAIDESRRFVVIGEQDGDLRIVSFDGTELWSIHRANGISSMAYNGKYLAVGDRGGWLALYKVDDPTNPTLVTNITDADAGYSAGVYAPTSLSSSGIGGLDRLSRIVVYHNPYNGYTWFLHIPTKTWYKYQGGTVNVICFAYPASVSPSGSYVYAGKTLFIVSYNLRPNLPSLQMDVTLKIPLLHHDSGKVMKYEPPEGLTVLFHTGTIRITSVVTLLRRMQLIEDPVISQAKFGLMYRRGMLENIPTTIRRYALWTSASSLRDVKVLSDNKIAIIWHHKANAPPYLTKAYSVAYSVFTIPINTPISPYDNITLAGSWGLVSVTGAWDWKKNLIGLVGTAIPTALLLESARQSALIASTLESVNILKNIAEITYMYSLSWDVAGKVVRRIQLELGTRLFGSSATLLSWATVAFLVFDLGVGTYFAKHLEAGSFWMVAPIFQDIRTGNKYLAVYVLLPEEEPLDQYEEAYNTTFGKDVDGMILVKVSWGKTWDDYKKLLEEGRIPSRFNLYQLADLISGRFGIPIEDLRLVSIKIGIMNRVVGRTSLWTSISGGIYAESVTVLFGNSIQLWVETKGGRKYTDPEEIASVLGNVIVNGENYTLIPSVDGAVAYFNIPNGADKLIITFPQRGLYLDGEIECKAKLIAPFEKVDQYKYYAKVHYNWEGVLARINKIELINMPEPALFIERIESYKYGTDTKLCYINTSYAGLEDMFKDTYEYQFWRRLGNMFEYVEEINNTWYYATLENTKWIDPFNGATLQPCKTWAFNYFVKLPPDVAVKIYFNGTNVVGTQPRHISFKLISNVEQKEVKLHWKILLKKFDYSVHDWVVNKTWEGDVSRSLTAVNQNQTFVILDADDYLGYAYKLMEEGYPVWIDVIGNITYASDGNYFKSNDYDKKALPLLITIPPLLGKNATLTVEVYDIYNMTPIPNALVILRYLNNTLVDYGNTNSSGMISFNITLGETYKIEAKKDGYTPLMGNITIAPLGNITVRYLMAPEGIGNLITPQNPSFRGNWTHPPYPIQLSNGTILWTLAVQVIYNDSAPFEGAQITIYEHGTSNIIAQGKTNGTGFAYFWIKNGTVIDVKCVATVNTTTYTFWRNNTLMDRSLWMVFTLPVQSPLYTEEVAVLWGEITIHRGQGYFFGNMTHCVRFLLWTNKPQTVTVTITVINAETNETITTIEKNYTLFLGVNPIYEWFSINASQGMEVRAWINITNYEYDTDPNNNALLTSPVWLKPFLDLKVFVLWHIVETKTDYALLPEDIIEVDIGIEVPLNLTKVPINLNITMRGVYLRKATPLIRKLENITAYRGIVWRNFTISLPWKREIIVYANASHPWEDMALNNVANITINIGPNAKVESVDVPSMVIEGREITCRYKIVSNLENEPILLYMHDNTTNSVVYTKQTTIVGNMTVTVTFKAPENPPILWVIRQPLVKHELVVGFSGYDAYSNDNTKPATITIVSRQAIWTLIIILALIIIITVITAIIARLLKAIITTTRPRKYLKLKS